jgi:hypothetical protein
MAGLGVAGHQVRMPVPRHTCPAHIPLIASHEPFISDALPTNFLRKLPAKLIQLPLARRANSQSGCQSIADIPGEMGGDSFGSAAAFLGSVRFLSCRGWGANAVTLGLDISARTENAANRLGDHLVFVHKDSACRSPGAHLGCNGAAGSRGGGVRSFMNTFCTSGVRTFLECNLVLGCRRRPAYGDRKQASALCGVCKRIVREGAVRSTSFIPRTVDGLCLLH